MRDVLNGTYRRQPAAGFLVLVVLICLIIITGITGVMTRHFVLTNQQDKRAFVRAQAELLAESGLERAAMQLSRDDSYRGETWSIPVEELDSQHAGEVTIHVTAGQAPNWNITATAIFPISNSIQAKSQRQVRFTKPMNNSGEPNPSNED